ncbi:MAG: hypothetical protein JSS11_17290 [Verrucomicrobia bacterium]|nr:hypothetical protein [Verrucomicrobiota bacterium]
MKTNVFLTTAQVTLVSLTALMTLASGCGGTYSGGAVYSSGPGPVIVDDYDYYPGYEVYYSRVHHDYYYRDHNAWVRRPAPPGIPPAQFHTAPFVHMDFHDTPDRHHGTVIKTYPKNWRPPAPKPPVRRDDHDDHRPPH